MNEFLRKESADSFQAVVSGSGGCRVVGPLSGLEVGIDLTLAGRAGRRVVERCSHSHMCHILALWDFTYG